MGGGGGPFIPGFGSPVSPDVRDFSEDELTNLGEHAIGSMSSMRPSGFLFHAYLEHGVDPEF